MRCSLFHRRVNELLDERSDPGSDAAIQSHAETCTKCRSELEGYKTFVAAFHPATTRVSERKQATTWGVFQYICLATAATLLISLTLAWRSPSLPVELASSAKVSLPVQSNSGEMVGASSFVQPILGIRLVANADWSEFQQVEMPFGVQMPEVETDWIDDVAKEMAPIRQSVDSTFSLIFRSLST